ERDCQDRAPLRHHERIISKRFDRCSVDSPDGSTKLSCHFALACASRATGGNARVLPGLSRYQGQPDGAGLWLRSVLTRVGGVGGSVLDRLEQLADRLLDLDRQLLGERGALLGDQRRQAAGGLRDRAAKLLAPIAIGLWKRDLTKLPRQQRRLAALVERDSPDRLQGLLVGGAGL